MGLTLQTAAMVWLIFYSEFEWWGQKYKPSEEVCHWFNTQIHLQFTYKNP